MKIGLLINTVQLNLASIRCMFEQDLASIIANRCSDIHTTACVYLCVYKMKERQREMRNVPIEAAKSKKREIESEKQEREEMKEVRRWEERGYL